MSSSFQERRGQKRGCERAEAVCGVYQPSDCQGLQLAWGMVMVRSRGWPWLMPQELVTVSTSRLLS